MVALMVGLLAAMPFLVGFAMTTDRSIASIAQAWWLLPVVFAALLLAGENLRPRRELGWAFAVSWATGATVAQGFFIGAWQALAFVFPSTLLIVLIFHTLRARLTEPSR